MLLILNLIPRNPFLICTSNNHETNNIHVSDDWHNDIMKNMFTLRDCQHEQQMCISKG